MDVRRTIYQVAGQSLPVEARDAWSASVIDTLFAGWYLAGDDEAAAGQDMPAIVMKRAAQPIQMPAGLQEFAIADGGTCYTDGRRSFIDVEGSIVAIGTAGPASVEISASERLALQGPALTRVVSYALAAALRHRGLFELHAGAVVDPESGKGVLIIGPSGSGKSTLTVHLAAAGWPFLTDDVLLLRVESGAVKAWPLRRCFAVTRDTVASSRFLQTRIGLEETNAWQHDKQQFLPHSVFEAEFKDCCIPGTSFFSELTNETHSRVSRLSPGDAMALLIRMSPWSCYDRATAADHLAVLSALATGTTSYSLLAGRDLLDPERSVTLIASRVH